MSKSLAITALAAIAVMAIALVAPSRWERPVDQLRIMTDIDLTGSPNTVEYLHIEGFDRTGYRIHLNKEQNEDFIRQLDRLTGDHCVSSAYIGKGCGFFSKKGYSVGVIKIGECLYDIQNT